MKRLLEGVRVTWSRTLVVIAVLTRVLACIVAVTAAVLLVPAVDAAVLERVSVSGGGAQGDEESGGPSISADGRYVAFASAADNLVAGDTNGDYDVFVYDQQADTVRRVSVATGGAQANGDSRSPVMSGDGKCVAFISRATNLVSGDTNGKWDVFVHTLASGETTRVSVATGGTQANGDCTRVSLDADGSLVGFTSRATNIVVGDTNGVADVFVRDRTAGTTQRVSVGDDEGQAGRGSDSVSVSGDGRYVAFDSIADNLVVGDTNGKWDVFVRDRQSGSTTRVSVDSAGVQASGDSICPSISADGKYVAFESEARDLVGGDTGGLWDVFVRDIAGGATERVSLSSAEVQGDDDSDSASVSGEGRYVAFVSQATNLVSGDTNGMGDVFVRDRTLGTTQRVSVSLAGVQGYDDSDSPALSAGGAFVACESWADRLVALDTNGCADVFVGEIVNIPTVATLSSTRGAVLGGTTVVITGSYFSNVTAVTFGGVAATFKVDSITQITAISPAHAQGTVQVRVVARGASSEDTPSDDFTYFPATLYQQTDGKIGYLGPWSTRTTASASGGDFYYAGAPGAAALISFEGRGVTWVAKTGPVYGKAEVSLDGGVPVVVDLYSAAELFRREVYDSGELADGPHTLTIRYTGKKNPASAGYFVDVDALKVMGALTQASGPRRYQEVDANLSYAGFWSPSASTAVSGGGFDSAGSAGAAVNISFKGTYMGWIAKTGPQYGMARVSLDGGPATTVDLYSAIASYRQCVYNTGIIADAAHKVSISWTGARRSGATASYIDIDAVDVLGTLTPASLPTPVTVTYQQTDPRLTYLNAWSSATSVYASGGGFYFASRWGSSVTACFQGKSITVLAKTGPQYGIAKISLDGGPKKRVDFYSSYARFQQKVYSVSGLANGAHTLSIEWTGEKRAAATGNYVDVDAVRVLGVLTRAPKPLRYQQTDKGLVYSGPWATSISTLASGGTFAYLKSPGSVAITWTGTSLRWVTKGGPQYGIAKLILDGGAPYYVDLYRPTALHQQHFYVTGVLPYGTHTLVIARSGAKNGASSDYIVGIDAVDVVGTLGASAK
jgi:Tol biopolymer transport system component